jgi:putative ubiquitin-RnfH superfamily antitoxin RatB of RatAB toxin-antitoxin module
VRKLNVEVVYALPTGEDAVGVAVSAGSTLRDALLESGLALRHPEIDPVRVRLGVFGRERSPNEPVADGDRVEVYRALKVDPRQARRERARRVSRRTSR